MKTPLATVPLRQQHPPQPTTPVKSYPVRRVGPLDRAALHLGVALIKWGRRPVKVDLREHRHAAVEAEQAGAQRDTLRDEFLALNLYR